MTPDDEHPRSHSREPAAAEPGDAPGEGAGDDLESLAGALPSLAPAGDVHEGQEADEEIDLGALAALGGQRPSLQQAEDEARVSLSGVGVATSPATPAASAPQRAAETRASQPPQVAAAQAPAAQAPAPQAVAPAPARAAWVVPLLVGLGIGAAAAAAVFLSAKRDDAPATTAAATEGTPPAGAQASAAAPAPAVLAAQAPKVAAATDEGAAGAAAVPATAPDPSAAAAAHRPASAAGPRVARPAAPAASPGVAPAPGSDAPVLAVHPVEEAPATPDAKLPAADANAKTGTSRSVDALLDEALAPAAQRQELARAQQAALEQDQLPVTPSREDVTQAMTVLLPAIRGCAMGQSGLAMASIVVRNDGKVAGVEITNPPFTGTASGRCMEGVIRRARFTRFTQPTLRVKFPLSIQ